MTAIEGKWFDKIALKEAIRDLEDREKLIVYLRYYKDQTQSEVAVRLGISQVQVSRLEKKILQQMKDRMDIIAPIVVFLCLIILSNYWIS